MLRNALILLTVVFATATPGLAAFKFDHLQGALPSATVGVALKIDIGIMPVNNTTLNSATYSISSGSLPNGLTFANVTNSSGMFGEISGTPTTVGTSNFTVSVVANMSD